MPSTVPFMWLGKTSSKTPFAGVGNDLIFSCRRVISFVWFKFYFYGISSHWLKQILALGHVKEFAHATNVFAPLALVLASSEMINALLTLHPSDTNSPYSDSLLDFQRNSNLELFMNSFRLAFLHMYHLWSFWHNIWAFSKFFWP